jgi:hypothetical protein
MLTAIIILALLSLLVATEEDSASAPIERTTDQPVRLTGKCFDTQKPDKPDRLAA